MTPSAPPDRADRPRKSRAPELAWIALLFAGYGLLPEQLVPGPRITPERRLLLAVLEEAHQNLLLARRGVVEAKHQRLVQDAREWVLADVPDDPFAFTGLCTQLGWSASAVRAAFRAQGLL